MMNNATRRFFQTCTVLVIGAACVWVWIEESAFLTPFGSTGLLAVGVMFVWFIQHKGTWLAITGWTGMILWSLITFLFGYAFAWTVFPHHRAFVRFSLSFVDGIAPILGLYGLYLTIPVLWTRRKR